MESHIIFNVIQGESCRHSWSFRPIHTWWSRRHSGRKGSISACAIGHRGSGKRKGGTRPSGWDPDERIKDPDIDGVCAEVLYPSLGLVLFSMTDTERQQASFRAYNAWLGEFALYRIDVA